MVFLWNEWKTKTTGKTADNPSRSLGERASEAGGRAGGHLRVATLLQVEFEVVVVGRREVDEFERTAERRRRRVEARGDHRAEVLVL